MRHGVSITLLQEKRQEQEEWERSGAAEHSPSHPLGPSSTSGPSTLLYAELTPSKTSSPTSSTSPTSPVTPVTHTPALREIPTPVEALRGPTSHANATSGARAARLTRFSEGTGESRRSPPRASRPRSLRSNNSRSSHSLLLPPQQPSSHNVSQARLTLRAAAPQGQKLVRTTAVGTYELVRTYAPPWHGGQHPRPLRPVISRNLLHTRRRDSTSIGSMRRSRPLRPRPPRA